MYSLFIKKKLKLSWNISDCRCLFFISYSKQLGLISVKKIPTVLKANHICYFFKFIWVKEISMFFERIRIQEWIIEGNNQNDSVKNYWI